MKISLIAAFAVLFLVSISFASALCYQESANTTNQGGNDGNCGLNYGGSYAFGTNQFCSPLNLGNIIDGIWTNFGRLCNQIFTPSPDLTFNVTYKKPNGVLSTGNKFNLTFWEEGSGIVTRELDIPSGCMTNNPTDLNITFKEYYNQTDHNKYLRIDCIGNPAPNWETYLGDGQGEIYEEAVIWNLPSAPQQPQPLPLEFSLQTPANNSLVKSFVVGTTCNIGNLQMSRITVATDLAFNNVVAGWTSATPDISHDFSALPAGTYYFIALCINSSGIASQSEIRKVEFDRNFSSPNFVSPTPFNNSIINNLIINMTCSPAYSKFGYSRVVVATDLAFNNVVAGWSSGYNLFYAFSGLREGTYYFIGHCADSFGRPLFFTEIRRIELDKTAPVSTLSLTYPGGAVYNGENTTSSIYATLSCSDSHACTPYYRLNNGAWQAYTSTVAISTVGTNILDYYSQDVAGNTETARSRTIVIVTGPINNQTNHTTDECEHDSDCDDDEECDDGECVDKDDDNDNLPFRYCGDGVCESSRGENEQSCSADCKSNTGQIDISQPLLVNSAEKEKKLLGLSKLGWVLIILGILIIAAIIVLLFIL